MLQIVIPEQEVYDEVNNLFMQTKEIKLSMEHSLLSISKWESHWKKPFLSKETKTDEEIRDYIKCMTINPSVPDDAFGLLTRENIQQIKDYIEDPMTATTVSSTKKEGAAPSREIITSEVIYYWMIGFNIPMECQKWHINRLLTLIRVCDEKSKPKKNLSQREIMERNRQLNEQRKKQMNSKG